MLTCLGLPAAVLLLPQDDDEKHQKRVGAKGKLEQYAYGLRSTIDDPKTKDKVSPSDRETIEKAVKETQSWLESNESADAEVFEAKQKELEGVCQPIIMQIYSAGGGAPGGCDQRMRNKNNVASRAIAQPRAEENLIARARLGLKPTFGIKKLGSCLLCSLGVSSPLMLCASSRARPRRLL